MMTPTPEFSRTSPWSGLGSGGRHHGPRLSGMLTDLGSGLQQQRRAPFHSRPIFESEVSRCSMSMRSVFRRHSELIMGLSDSRTIDVMSPLRLIAEYPNTIQYVSLKPNCRFRGLKVPPACPKFKASMPFFLAKFAPGSWKLVWLNTLNASARN